MRGQMHYPEILNTIVEQNIFMTNNGSWQRWLKAAQSEYSMSTQVLWQQVKWQSLCRDKHIAVLWILWNCSAWEYCNRWKKYWQLCSCWIWTIGNVDWSSAEEMRKEALEKRRTWDLRIGFWGHWCLCIYFVIRRRGRRCKFWVSMDLMHMDWHVKSLVLICWRRLLLFKYRRGGCGISQLDDIRLSS